MQPDPPASQPQHSATLVHRPLQVVGPAFHSSKQQPLNPRSAAHDAASPAALPPGWLGRRSSSDGAAARPAGARIGHAAIQPPARWSASTGMTGRCSSAAVQAAFAQRGAGGCCTRRTLCSTPGTGRACWLKSSSKRRCWNARSVQAMWNLPSGCGTRPAKPHPLETQPT